MPTPSSPHSTPPAAVMAPPVRGKETVDVSRWWKSGIVIIGGVRVVVVEVGSGQYDNRCNYTHTHLIHRHQELDSDNSFRMTL